MTRISLWLFKWLESWPVKNVYLTYRREMNGFLDICGEDNPAQIKLMRIAAKCHTSKEKMNKILDNLK